MSIIDLETGQLVEPSAPEGLPVSGGAPLPEPIQQPSGIIDLETGAIVDSNNTGKPFEAGEVQLSPFPEDREQTRAARELPELGSGGLLGGEDKAKTAGIAGLLMATTDPNEIGSILSENFPNIGISTDPGGNQLARNNATGAEVIINAPGISKLDVLQGLGIMSAFTPAGRAAALTGSALKSAGLSGAKALAGTAAAGAGASGLTQGAIEGIQSQVGGDLDESEIAIATALGGAAELVVPAIKAVRQSRQAKRLDVARGEVAETVERIAPAREAQSAVAEATGVDVPLFQAQQTQQPSTLLKQRLLPQLDAGAKAAAKSLEGQNKQAFEATSELINTIAPPEAVSTGSKRFRDAAKLAVDAGKERRSEAVRPLFDEALETGASVDIKPVSTLIEESLRDAPKTGKAAQSILKVKSLLSGNNGAPPTLRQLQKAKFEMDDMIEAFGDNALGNTTKREVVQIKQTLVDQMEQASPLYKAGNDEFKRLSPAVTELQDSIIGSVSKIDDVTLKNVSRRIFDVTESNPEVIKNAKSIIDNVDPGAWDDLLRVEFQRRMGGIETLAEDLPGELVGNVPGQLRRSLFGNPAQRKTLLSAMNPEQRKNFVYLDELLKRASSGRQAGSPTAPFGEALDRLKGSAGVVRDMIFRPLQSLQEFGERGLFDRNVSKLTDVMFNPKWQPKLKELRNAPPQSERARAILSELMNSAKASVQTTKAGTTDSGNDQARQQSNAN